jgi:DNA-binding NtrC family response regulator
MNLRVYDLRVPRHHDPKIADWKQKLRTLAPFVDYVDFEDSSLAAWAPWCGDPFLLVGSPNELTGYFSRIDSLDRRALEDNAYYWCLTSASDYENPLFMRAGRPVALNWHHGEQNVVNERLHLLDRFDRLNGSLKGLSKGMHLLREEILRIAVGPVSPGYPVLIHGASGSGKEEVARSLFDASSRSNKKLHAVGGAWLKLEPGLALTEMLGLEPGRAHAQAYPGLLELFRDGAIFLDDFESAPPNVFEALLRIMATHRGRPATYRKVGGLVDRQTHVWLMFATNQPLEQLLDSKSLREDIFYRFEDRILVIPPLRERLADMPAIALTIWDQLWEFDSQRKVPLGLVAVKRLAEADLAWEGNVRTLRALLGLVVSMRSNPAHNASPPSDLMSVIISRGKRFGDWVGIFRTGYFKTGESLLARIRQGDAGQNCFGPSAKHGSAADDKAPSVLAARGVLKAPDGWDLFVKLASTALPTKSSNTVRANVRLARIVCYVAENGSISASTAQQLGASTDGEKLSEATAIKDLAVLANINPELPRQRKPAGPGLLLPKGDRGTTYIKHPDYFVSI